MKDDKNFIYLLMCTGEDVFLDSEFKAICTTAFKENPLITDKYITEVNGFLKDCKDKENHISAVKEETEKLSIIKLQII